MYKTHQQTNQQTKNNQHTDKIALTIGRGASAHPPIRGECLAHTTTVPAPQTNDTRKAQPDLPGVVSRVHYHGPPGSNVSPLHHDRRARRRAVAYGVGTLRVRASRSVRKYRRSLALPP